MDPSMRSAFWTGPSLRGMVNRLGYYHAACNEIAPRTGRLDELRAALSKGREIRVGGIAVFLPARLQFSLQRDLKILWKGKFDPQSFMSVRLEAARSYATVIKTTPRNSSSLSRFGAIPVDDPKSFRWATGKLNSLGVGSVYKLQLQLYEKRFLAAGGRRRTFK